LGVGRENDPQEENEEQDSKSSKKRIKRKIFSDDQSDDSSDPDLVKIEYTEEKSFEEKHIPEE
jgi:hypothetical protein